MKIKKESVSGLFYPKNKTELENLIAKYKQNTQVKSDYKSKLVIAPHAGYVYSGYSAYLSLTHLCGKNIFIFAPAHKMFVESIALCDYDAFSTPLGTVKVNKETVNEIIEKYKLKYNNQAFENEHAIEVQLPFLQTLKKDFTIVPILVGACNYSIIKDIIAYYYNNKDNSFVISTDLSHFLSDKQAKEKDNITANLIEKNLYKELKRDVACNAISICAAMDFANEHNLNFIRLDMRNSSDASGETQRVVGYGSWLLSDITKNQYIKKYYANLIKDICYSSIKYKGECDLSNYPAVLKQIGACFVTLEINNQLRGCIGTIKGYRSLIDDLISNAYMSAYKDPRFSPVTQDELELLDIKVSLLSEAREIQFKNEEDLLNKIVPFKDGIIISDLDCKAVYLPSVWEQLPDKKIFMASLKQKAGLSLNHFSSTFKVYKFYTEYI